MSLGCDQTSEESGVNFTTKTKVINDTHLALNMMYCRVLTLKYRDGVVA